MNQTNKSKEKIRLLICDDQSIVCEGLSVILSSTPNIEIVGVCYNGEECLEMVEKHLPDIVLMDLKMPVMNGIQATKAISEKFPHTRVLVLTTFDSDEWVIDAIRSGASGYLLKDTPREDLVKAIVGTARGLSHVDPNVAGKILNRFAKTSEPISSPTNQINNLLSERELEILHLLAQGLSNGEIAKVLYLTDGTVRNYISNIFTKIGVTDRTQAALFAYRSGLG